MGLSAQGFIYHESLLAENLNVNIDLRLGSFMSIIDGNAVYSRFNTAGIISRDSVIKAVPVRLLI